MHTKVTNVYILYRKGKTFATVIRMIHNRE